MTTSKVGIKWMVFLAQKRKYSPSLCRLGAGIGRTGSGPEFSSHPKSMAHGWDEAVAGAASSLLVACMVLHLMASRGLLGARLGAIVVRELAWKLAMRADHLCLENLAALGGVALVDHCLVSLVGAGSSAGSLAMMVNLSDCSVLPVASLLVAASKMSRNPLVAGQLLHALSPS